MNLKNTLDKFENDKSIQDEFVNAMERNQDLRVELVEYFRINKNREFIIGLLDKIISLRKQEHSGGSGDNVMLACYLLGLHNHVEDSLRIWYAKRTDFDSFCYVDIQLVPFSGVDKTIAYLKTLDDAEAKEAIQYLLECKDSADFDDLDRYYSTDEFPCYV